MGLQSLSNAELARRIITEAGFVSGSKIYPGAGAEKPVRDLAAELRELFRRHDAHPFMVGHSRYLSSVFAVVDRIGPHLPEEAAFALQGVFVPPNRFPLVRSVWKTAVDETTGAWCAIKYMGRKTPEDLEYLEMHPD